MNEYLKHYGILGMHWGVLRQSSNMSSKKVIAVKTRLIEAGKNALITAGILTASYLVGKAIKSG